MTLPDYFRFLRRWGWLIALGTIGLGIAAFFVTARMTPVYRAEATILVNQGQFAGAQTYQDILSSQQLTKTYAELATSDLNLERALKRLEATSLTLEDLDEMVTAHAIRDTQLIRIFAEHSDPQLAAVVASTVASVFPEYVEEAQLAGQQSSSNSLNTVFVAEPARTPAEPVRPSKTTNAVLGALFGLVLMVAITAALEYRDDGIDERADVQALGIPFIGSVFTAKKPSGSGKRWVPSILGASQQDQPLVESYRQVKSSLAFALGAADAKVILVTSSSPGEGKSTTSANLAQAFAESSARVLLIDADLRKPDAHRYFSFPNTVGLTTAFLPGMQGLQELLKQVNTNFFVLPAGPMPPNASELLASRKMKSIMERLAGPFDVVIIDCPPILGLADASMLSTLADGVVLVARKGKTRGKQLQDAVDAVAATHIPLLGVVLNADNANDAGNYYYRYGYGNTAPDSASSRWRFWGKERPASADKVSVLPIEPPRPRADTADKSYSGDSI